MQSNSFKDTICTSPASFVVAVLLLFVSRYFVSGLDINGWILSVGSVTLAFVLQKFSNENGLIRVRSWMLPTVYILFCTATHFVLKLDLSLLCIPFYAIAFNFLLQSYQQPHAERWIFSAFLLLGLGCLFYVPLLWMIPVFLLIMLAQLHTLNMRTLSAAFLALFIVAEFVLIYFYQTNQSEIVFSLWPILQQFKLPVLISWKLNEVLSFMIIMFLFIISFIHYFYTSYDDKIHTRLCFNVLIFQDLAILGLFLFRPQDVNVTMQLLLFGITPVVAHYFIFSKGVIANILFIYSMILLILLYIIGTWSSLLHIL